MFNIHRGLFGVEGLCVGACAYQGLYHRLLDERFLCNLAAIDWTIMRDTLPIAACMMLAYQPNPLFQQMISNHTPMRLGAMTVVEGTPRVKNVAGMALVPSVQPPVL